VEDDSPEIIVRCCTVFHVFTAATLLRQAVPSVFVSETKLLAHIQLKPSSIPILCVEDDETYLRLRKAVLAQAGYIVFSATTPSEAMEILGKTPISLVLSDHMLRGTTGTALAKEMKKIKPDVPIVLYSGAVPETMQHIDGFINKSEPIPSFLAMVREFVRRYCE